MLTLSESIVRDGSDGRQDKGESELGTSTAPKRLEKIDPCKTGDTAAVP